MGWEKRKKTKERLRKKNKEREEIKEIKSRGKISGVKPEAEEN